VYLFLITDYKGRTALGQGQELLSFWPEVVKKAQEGAMDQVSRAVRRYGPSRFEVKLLEEVEDQYADRRLSFYKRRLLKDPIVEDTQLNRQRLVEVTNIETGEKFLIQNRREFCRENKLSVGSFHRVIAGERKRTGKWTAREIGEIGGDAVNGGWVERQDKGLVRAIAEKDGLIQSLSD